MTGDSQGGWPERPAPRRSGRHSRAPQEYGDPDPSAAPDPYLQPGPCPQDQYRQPGPHPAPDRPAGRDPLTAPGGYPRPDPLTAPGGYPRPDPLTAPGGYPRPDPLASPARHQPPDPYAGQGRRARIDPLTAPWPYPPPGSSAPADSYATRPPLPPAAGDGGARTDPRGRPGRGAAPDALTDPSAGRPAPLPPRDDDGSLPPHARRRDRYDPLSMPGGQNGYGRRDAGDALTGNRQQNGPRAGAPYDGPAGDASGGYGPPDHGQAGGDPYRWRPPRQTPEPEELAPLPGYEGDEEPAPGGDGWDASQEHDWDASHDDDSAAGLAGPVSGPAGRESWQHEADEPGEWDDEASRDGLVPGFDDTGSGRGGRGGPRRRVSRVLAPLLAVVLLAVLGAGAYKIYRHFQSPDYTGPGTGEVTVQVLPGDTATSLAPRLVKLGVVASVNSFISAAKDSPNPAGLEPGFFRLRHHMNSALAYQLLLNPSARIQSVVTIPDGLRETQILQTLEARTGTPASAFAAALKDPAALGLPSYAGGNPEGYLFPATYNFSPGTSALAMLQAMVTRFNQEAASIGLPAAAKAAQLTEGQVIIVASLLEGEAGNPKYYPKVAEVIYNRLNQGMFLGLDSTVNYALHQFVISLTNAQLHVNSPYNTFIHTGLPPGPIDSPGNAAIEAALHPDHGDLLYFVTVNLKTGLTLFTSSPAQFQQFENECQQNNAC